MSSLRVLLLINVPLFTFVFAPACGSSGDDTVCTPGEQVTCACTEGNGVQACLADGSGFDTCQCSSGDGDGDGNNSSNNSNNSNNGNNNNNNGDGDGDGDGNNNNNGDGDGDGDAAWCCINGAYYGCPSDAAAQTCAFDFDPSGCTRDAAGDGTCDEGGDGDGPGGDGDGDGDGGSLPQEGAICFDNDDCAPQQTNMICVVDEAGDTQGICSLVCEEHWDCGGFDRCCEIFGGTRVCGEEDNWPEGACD